MLFIVHMNKKHSPEPKHNTINEDDEDVTKLNQKTNL